MFLAVDALTPEAGAILFGIAIVLFVIGGLGYQYGRVSFVQLGLAVFAFPFFWSALAAT